MTDLFWPGDERAGQHMTDAALLSAMAEVEHAWLGVLVDAGIAPPEARADLVGLVDAADAASIARRADVDGNPVSGFVALLRERTSPAAARWLHRGLTSQDVLDTALMLCARDVLHQLGAQFTEQVELLTQLVERHRSTTALARTLTQAALPSPLGLKFAHWLTGVLDAMEPLGRIRAALPVQAGGAVGTLAAATELAGSPDTALALGQALAAELGLQPSLPWHTTRSGVTRIGDVLVECCDAWGYLAADVATGSRTEVGEFRQGVGGGSSTMPHKHNPVLAVLIRRTVLTAGPLGATLHAAAGASVDERSDGAWHAEWATLRTLARRTLVAASHASELLATLQVDEVRVAANLEAADGLLAEQQSMTTLTGRSPQPEYVGAADRIIETVLERARRQLKEEPA